MPSSQVRTVFSWKAILLLGPVVNASPPIDISGKLRTRASAEGDGVSYPIIVGLCVAGAVVVIGIWLALVYRSGLKRERDLRRAEDQRQATVFTKFLLKPYSSLQDDIARSKVDLQSSRETLTAMANSVEVSHPARSILERNRQRNHPYSSLGSSRLVQYPTTNLPPSLTSYYDSNELPEPMEADFLCEVASSSSPPEPFLDPPAEVIKQEIPRREQTISPSPSTLVNRRSLLELSVPPTQLAHPSPFSPSMHGISPSTIDIQQLFENPEFRDRLVHFLNQRSASDPPSQVRESTLSDTPPSYRTVL